MVGGLLGLGSVCTCSVLNGDLVPEPWKCLYLLCLEWSLGSWALEVSVHALFGMVGGLLGLGSVCTCSVLNDDLVPEPWKCLYLLCFE